MKILLINPPSRGIYYRLGLTFPPLGLGYLAAVLRRRGHQVDILDLNVERTIAQSLDKFDWRDWDLVGISGDTSRHPVLLTIARLAKAAGKIVVAGGYHVTFLGEDALREGAVDYVVRGEGEVPFGQLVECLEAKGDVSQVPGISFIRDGRVVCTPDPPPIIDLDSIPWPAREALPMKKYRRAKLNGRLITTMVTSRGCPHGCTFCSSSRFAGRRWRARSVAGMVDEMEHIVSTYDYGALAFMDDNFTLSPRRVLAVCEEIIRRGLDIYWWCFSRVDVLVKKEAMIEKMAQAGARMVFLGIESVSQAVLDSYRKGITADMARRAVELLKKYGIRVWASFIIGDLADTKETIRETVKYACSLEPDIAEFSILTPFPGTQLFEEARKRGLIATYDWSRFDGAHATMETPHLTRRQIAREAIRAYLRFYLRPSRLKQVIAGLNLVRG